MNTHTLNYLTWISRKPLLLFFFSFVRLQETLSHSKSNAKRNGSPNRSIRLAWHILYGDFIFSCFKLADSKVRTERAFARVSSFLLSALPFSFTFLIATAVLDGACDRLYANLRRNQGRVFFLQLYEYYQELRLKKSKVCFICSKLNRHRSLSMVRKSLNAIIELIDRNNQVY